MGPEKVQICRECAGRMMERGCSLPLPAEPIYGESVPCALCG